MEAIEYKLANISKMVSNLNRSITELTKAPENYQEFLRDSVASRFEILIESSWKVIKLHMENLGSFDLPGSPKEILALAYQENILSKFEYEKCLSLLKLRNMASHIYSEEQYLLVIGAAPEAVKVIKDIMDRITKNMKVLNFE